MKIVLLTAYIRMQRRREFAARAFPLHFRAAECIVCGAGSDQLIDLIIRLTVNPRDEIINLPRL